MYDAPSIYLLGYLASKGLVFINMAYVQKLKAFQHFICHTLRHRSCITISQWGFAECAERLVCMDAYADTHIQNHAWTQLHADTNAFQCVLFTQIQIHNNSCQKKNVFWFGVIRVCRLTPSTLPAMRRDATNKNASRTCNYVSVRACEVSQYHSSL